MNQVGYIVLVLVTLALFSCKREEIPEPQIGDPVFYIDYEFDGTANKLVAGEDAYYMHTTRSFPEPDLIDMVGTMAPLDEIVTNAPKIAVHIRNFEDTPQPVVNSDSALKPGMYPFRTSNDELSAYVVKFFALLPQATGIYEYSWDFGDGSPISTEANPRHIYTDLNIGKYNVCLTITSDTACTSQLCTDVFMPNAQCTADITMNAISPLDYVFTATHTGVDPVRYSWSFGSVNSNAQSATVDYNYVVAPQSGDDQICVTITDAAGCEANYCENLILDPVRARCTANFNYFATDTIVNVSTKEYSSVLIEYWDETGKKFTSEHPQQPASSRFQIVESDSYKANREGLPTSALQILANCMVYAVDDTLSPTAIGKRMIINDAKIAVGHP